MQSIKQLARADELAQRLSCGKSTVYQLTKAGKIPFVDWPDGWNATRKQQKAR
jgi:predicted DNA-binding transcriptional regulator AlpA